MSRKHRQKKLRAREGSRLRDADAFRYRTEAARRFVDNARRANDGKAGGE